MSLIDDIREEIQQIASERGLSDDKAFGYWFLEKYEDLSPEEAESVITDGPWDQGRDAVYFDDENQRLRIYQFKYSQDPSYIKQGLKDLQNGLIAEEARLKTAEGVDLLLVTIASAESFKGPLETAKRSVKSWLKKQGLDIEPRLEIVDLKRFRQLSERLYGVDVTLEWKLKHIMENKAIIGLLNASGLRSVVDRDELFSFNIRQFLGIRKGSVGWRIKQTLQSDPNNLWILNNGIVCLCTDFLEEDDKIKFKDFTIVNGAQTVNTIAKFLQDYPTYNEPIWVVAKVLKVGEDEVDWSFKITEASNTQTPTSTRDLKAIDLSHRWIEQELQKEFGLAYVYKRGQRAIKGGVRMKDLAQAYIAFWREAPHLAYGRPGQIFADDKYYEEVFPPSRIEKLREQGTTTKRKQFLLKLLLPWKITVKARNFIRSHTGGETGYDKKYRSLTYHLVWIYKKLLESKVDNEGIQSVDAKLDDILNKTLEQLFIPLCDLFYPDVDFPRCLKSADAVEKLKAQFISRPSVKSISNTIQSV